MRTFTAAFYLLFFMTTAWGRTNNDCRTVAKGNCVSKVVTEVFLQSSSALSPGIHNANSLFTLRPVSTSVRMISR